MDRTPPSSPEAEDHVIACCLLDDGVTIDRCVEAHVSPDSFYSPANRAIFEVILDIRKTPTIDVLAEELKSRKLLEAVGGFQYLMQVSSRTPTTTHAGYFIEALKEKQHLRTLIRLATATIEKAYGFTNGDLDELLESARTSIDAVRDEQAGDIIWKPLTEFEVPPDDDPSTLLGNRYLNRGDGALLVSTSGMGKSSITLQMAVLWSLGKPAFGIQPNAAGLTSVIIQAEDSDGDIGEVWAGLKHELKLTDAEYAIVKKRVIIIEERVARGQSFLVKVRAIVRKFKPDLLWINPLLAFADGDTTKAEVMGKFLREGLNQINSKKEFGYFIIHHTPKPPQMEKKQTTTRKWNEVMYDGAGSADLTNWARAIMVLKATEVEGEFDLVLAKRGKRAGAVIEVPQGAGVRVEATNILPLKHATGSFSVPGRKKPLAAICWLPRTPTPEPVEESGSETETIGDEELRRLLQYYPASDAEPEGFPSCYRLATQAQHITKADFEAARLELLRLGLIERTEDMRYVRTEDGDFKFLNI